MPRLDELIARRFARPFDSGEPLADTAELITANAYLGCWGIVEALERGADIVITGRVTDAAVVCGPAAWHHGWCRDDWDALAGAVVAGHVIECGAQATGGNYSFFTEVSGMARVGLPVRRDRRRRLVGDRQARRHGRRGVDRHRHVATALRDHRPPLSRPRRHRPLRHDHARSSRSRPGAHQWRTRRATAADTLKVAANRIGGFRNQRHRRAHRARRRRQGRARRDRVLASVPRTHRRISSQSRRPLVRPGASPTARPTRRPPGSGGSRSRTPTSARSAARSPTPSSSWRWRRSPVSTALGGGPAAATPYGVYVPAHDLRRSRSAVRRTCSVAARSVVESTAPGAPSSRARPPRSSPRPGPQVGAARPR